MASITTATLDKSSYVTGQLMTLTVNGSGLDQVDVISELLSPSQPLNESITIGEVAVSDTLGKPWTQVSNNGTVAVFTATA